MVSRGPRRGVAPSRPETTVRPTPSLGARPPLRGLTPPIQALLLVRALPLLLKVAGVARAGRRRAAPAPPRVVAPLTASHKAALPGRSPPAPPVRRRPSPQTALLIATPTRTRGGRPKARARAVAAPLSPLALPAPLVADLSPLPLVTATAVAVRAKRAGRRGSAPLAEGTGVPSPPPGPAAPVRRALLPVRATVRRQPAPLGAVTRLVLPATPTVGPGVP